MKKAKRIISVFTMLALVAVMVFAQGAEETAAAKKDVINVIYHPTVGGSTTIATAINKGFFEEENLDVKLQMYTSGPPEIAAMVAGQADFGFIGSGAAWLAFSGQVDIIALDNMALTEEIIARTGRGIETIKDLKGKTIAVQEGAAGYTLLQVALQSVGLKISDVKVLNISNDNIPSTYNDASIDAWAGWKPSTTSLKSVLGESGYKLLANNASYPDYAFPSTWVANKDFIRNNPDITNRFLRALTKAEVYRSEHPEEACAFASTYAQQPTNDLTAQLPDVNFPGKDELTDLYKNGGFKAMLENLRSVQSAKVTGSLTIDEVCQDSYVLSIINEI